MDSSDTAPTPTLKTMPIASVIYAVSFDEAGLPTVQAAIHTDTAGRQLFTGDAARAYTLLSPALDATVTRLATSLTQQLTQAIEEKRLLNGPLHTTPTA